MVKKVFYIWVCMHLHVPELAQLEAHMFSEGERHHGHFLAQRSRQKTLRWYAMIYGDFCNRGDNALDV